MEEREQVINLAFCGGAIGLHNFYLRQYARGLFKILLVLVAFNDSILLGAGVMALLNLFSGVYALTRY